MEGANNRPEKTGDISSAIALREDSDILTVNRNLILGVFCGVRV